MKKPDESQDEKSLLICLLVQSGINADLIEIRPNIRLITFTHKHT